MANIPKDDSQSFILQVDNASEQSIDVYYEFFEGSTDVAKREYTFAIYEAEEHGSTVNLNYTTGQYAHGNEIIQKDSDTIIISKASKYVYSFDDKPFMLEKDKLYALCLYLGKPFDQRDEKSRYDDYKNGKLDLSAITFFQIDKKIDTEEGALASQTTTIKLNEDSKVAISAKYSIPKNTLAGSPDKCKHSVRLYKTEKAYLFNSEYVYLKKTEPNNWLAEYKITSDVKEGTAIFPEYKYEDLQPNETYTVVYCLEQTVMAGFGDRIQYFAAATEFTHK